ncbi:MAG: outer membrane protein assembly factor BamC [Arsenophonus sp.]
MLILFRKLNEIKILIISFTIFLISCNGIDRNGYKRQVNDNESYLNTPPLKNLIIPKGMSLPLQNREFDILLANQNGVIGKALDIRPPIQILLLLGATHSDNSLTSSRLFLSKTDENSNLWSQINTILQQKMIKITEKNDSNYFLITDWITWSREDEDIHLQTMQKISLDSQNNQLVITVTNENIKRGNKNIIDPMEIQRYNTLMLNELIYSINKLRNMTRNSDA